MPNGALAKKPPKNRQTKMVCKFCATATGIWKIAKIKNPMNNGILRPYSSLSGPNIKGPKLNPNTNRLVPRTMTSCDTPNFCDVGFIAVLKTDDAKVTETVMKPSMRAMDHLRKLLKFRGCSYIISMHCDLEQRDAVQDHPARPNSQCSHLHRPSLFQSPRLAEPDAISHRIPIVTARCPFGCLVPL